MNLVAPPGARPMRSQKASLGQVVTLCMLTLNKFNLVVVNWIVLFFCFLLSTFVLWEICGQLNCQLCDFFTNDLIHFVQLTKNDSPFVLLSLEGAKIASRCVDILGHKKHQLYPVVLNSCSGRWLKKLQDIKARAASLESQLQKARRVVLRINSKMAKASDWWSELDG